MENKPYFMNNKSWYNYDTTEQRYKLTSKAPQKAVKSYNDFYVDEIITDENGEQWIVN